MSTIYEHFLRATFVLPSGLSLVADRMKWPLLSAVLQLAGRCDKEMLWQGQQSKGLGSPAFRAGANEEGNASLFRAINSFVKGIALDHVDDYLVSTYSCYR